MSANAAQLDFLSRMLDGPFRGCETLADMFWGGGAGRYLLNFHDYEGVQYGD